jgi:hypothetical protein
VKGPDLKRVAKPGSIDDSSGDGSNDDEDDDEDMLAAKKAKLANDPGHTVFDAKFQALVKLLEQVRAEDETSKVLIFSQFGSTITMLQSILPQRGYQYRTLTGGMNRSQRGKALRDFQNDPSTTVFLSKCFGGYTLGSILIFVYSVDSGWRLRHQPDTSQRGCAHGTLLERGGRATGDWTSAPVSTRLCC